MMASDLGLVYGFAAGTLIVALVNPLLVWLVYRWVNRKL